MKGAGVPAGDLSGDIGDLRRSSRWVNYWCWLSSDNRHQCCGSSAVRGIAPCKAPDCIEGLARGSLRTE